MLKVNVLNIEEGERIFNFCVPSEEIGIDDPVFFDNINVDIAVTKSLQQIDFHIRLHTNVKVDCDRCLKPIILECNNDFKLVFKPAIHKRDVSAAEDEIEDFRFYNPDSKYLEITNDVRDYLMLGMPMKRTPPEVNGVCSVCNKKIEEILSPKKAKKEINPVWEKLIELKTKK
jgi:uncharacterized metal-binding protein YceD (DUF177 family)